MMGSLIYLHKQAWGRIVIGMTLAILLLVLKITLAEPRGWYGHSRLATYNLIQRALSLGKLPKSLVTVVDISRISKQMGSAALEYPKNPPKALLVTSRGALQRTVDELLKAKPLGIAIDVDFSREYSGNPVAFEDSDFFAHMKENSDDSHRIFLGVYRQATKSPQEWFGDSTLAEMGVGLGIGNDRYQGVAAEMKEPVAPTLRMLAWTHVKGQSTHVKSLSASLAEAVRPRLSEVPSWLSWAIEDRSEITPDPKLETEGFLVDYSTIDDELSNAIPFDQVSAKEGRVDGHVVILGIARHVDHPAGKEGDLFRVPAHQGWYSGTLVHGCAVNTLLAAPLHQWTPVGKIFADLLLALLAVVSIELIVWACYTRKGKEHHGFHIPWLIAGIVSTLMILVAVPFVGLLRLVWDDAFFVALGLLAHTALDHFLTVKVDKAHHHEALDPETKPNCTA
jgi:CHASE2 domain-containing sensor protein